MGIGYIAKSIRLEIGYPVNYYFNLPYFIISMLLGKRINKHNDRSKNYVN